MTDHSTLGGSPETIRVAPASRPTGFMLAKRGIQAIFTVLALPRLISYWISRMLLGRRSFGASSESIARTPGLRGVYLRQAFYRHTLEQCGQDVYFGWLSVLSMPEARVGDRAFIGRFCSIGFAEIAEEALLADGVQILSGGREHDQALAPGESIQEQGQSYSRVRIGRGAWIGAGAIIMADVGEGTIVGAGAVVNRPLPSHCVAVGAPARVIKTLQNKHNGASD
jgi:acetyltransferase-like isoleucine patch superfamily enzyme